MPGEALNIRANTEALEIKFLKSEVSLNKFYEQEKPCDKVLFYKIASENKWMDKRKELWAKAKAKVMDQLPDKIVERFLRLNAVLDKVINRLEGNITEGKQKNYELKIAAETVSEISKTLSFLNGGPTERTENKSLNLHAHIVNEIQERDKKLNVDL